MPKAPRIGGGDVTLDDASLRTRWDWEKYSYWYRTWGRLMYNPETDPEVWHREFGADAKARRPGSGSGVCVPPGNGGLQLICEISFGLAGSLRSWTVKPPSRQAP